MAATCRACPAPLIWCKMVPSGKRNPLDQEPAEVDLEKPLAGRGLVALNPKTGCGVSVTAKNEQDVRKWLETNSVQLHVSHFSSCPARKHFRRKRTAS